MEDKASTLTSNSERKSCHCGGSSSPERGGGRVLPSKSWKEKQQQKNTFKISLQQQLIWSWMTRKITTITKCNFSHSFIHLIKILTKFLLCNIMQLFLKGTLCNTEVCFRHRIKKIKVIATFNCTILIFSPLNWTL